jgi:hypothetical protein
VLCGQVGKAPTRNSTRIISKMVLRLMAVKLLKRRRTCGAKNITGENNVERLLEDEPFKTALLRRK